MKRIVALCLCLAVLLCGCGAKNVLGYHGVVKYSEMTYTRPDMDEVAESCQNAMDAAAEAVSADAVLEAVWDFYDVYNRFQTNYNLAYIRCHGDVEDYYWQSEQEYCAANAAQLELYLEDLYYALADCALRDELEEEYFGPGYFDAYEGEGWYDEELVAMMEREQELISQYYAHSDDTGTGVYTDAYYDENALPMAQLLAELVALRQEMAAWVGYDSYTDFAWDYYYYRDYTPDQAEIYLEQIRDALVPLYRRVGTEDVWAPGSAACSEREVYSYVKNTARAMGGVTEEAFRLLEQGKLYDISASPKKSGMSFEVYLPNYYQPYIFLSGTGTAYDCLTFVHEFGHFANDYASAGSGAGIDVMEVFSQGMEYLSLCYGKAPEGFETMKLADSLSVYVEQAAYAAFEQEIYDLDPALLTAAGLLACYEEICTAYGFDAVEWDPRDMITVPHFYSNPMYIISYVVSNDAAMQLYQMELETPGTGKAVFERSLSTESWGLMEYLEEAGLESPFDRVEKVKELMETRFG